MNFNVEIDVLRNNLETGFINSTIISSGKYKPKLLTNSNIDKIKILNTIQKELKDCEEFFFSVAFLTTSGLAVLFNILEELQSRNIKGKILVSQYLNFTQPEALKKLLYFKNIESKIVVNGNFHAKGYLFKTKDIYNLIIGSSNLTANALCVNKEWNLKISATKDSSIIQDAIKEFENEFEKASSINSNFIEKYLDIYKSMKQNKLLIEENYELIKSIEIKPNLMQKEALNNLQKLREKGKKRSLLISATGTGKTYLSAFDVKNFNPKKVLFVVHRLNIAKAALKTFQTIFKDTKSMGLFSGFEKNMNVDFIFSTIQTISKEDNLKLFNPNSFDYIIIDETHRAGAQSYTKLINYFKPKFLLGMTATPERTDGLDIFKLFDYNIAYEIRLHNAMEENMLSPFHYFGVSDISINEELLKEKNAFNLLTTDERVERIIENIEKYGVDNGNTKGLIFCSSVEESKILSFKFNDKGYRTVSLSGLNTEKEREEAIEKLESNDEDKLDYIFTVDIFNEGVDIPKINQIVMLRPTQSAIIFVQQLGRGLRKTEDKEYLTVIDFIGNYNNNYLIPIALYGDTSFNKDNLRKALTSNILPGASTINFDRISLERIYKSIDSSNLQLKKDLLNDYTLLKYKIGHIPMMIDFLKDNSRDPFAYVNYSKSYLNFIISVEDDIKNALENQNRGLKLLEYFYGEINNGKRIEETLILKYLISNSFLIIDDFKKIILESYNYLPSDTTINSAINNINLNFITEKENNKLISVGKKYDYKIVKIEDNQIIIEKDLTLILENDICKKFLIDSINYSEMTFNKVFNKTKNCDGFYLYEKYTRKDVFRILNWEQNPVAQNVGGYIVSQDKTNCPIFVNYHKEEDISATTKYEDHFIDNNTFSWMSKSKRKLTSPDIMTIKDNDNLLIPLFIKKHNDEGTEFYYMGNLKPVKDSFEETYLMSNDSKKVSVVRVKFELNHHVEDYIYNYITHDFN
jgi:superfamily II DNA or RNA helicase